VSALQIGRPADRGFTLVEVLVALVIVAVGMSAMMGALTSSAKSVAYMQDKTFAEWVALNQIAVVRTTIKAPGQLPPLGKTNGDVDFANRKWHWYQEVVASQVSGIVRVDVKARPKDVGSSSDDDNANWYVTVSGIVGNAMAPPGTGQPWFNGATGPGQGIPNSNTPNQLGNPGGTSPGQGNTPGTGTPNMGTPGIGTPPTTINPTRQ
jgi:general secretion pathway protein I